MRDRIIRMLRRTGGEVRVEPGLGQPVGVRSVSIERRRCDDTFTRNFGVDAFR